MPSHMTAAYAAVNHAMRSNKKKSGKSLLSMAKRKANKSLNGAGNSKPMLKAAANYLANHPNSTKAQKMVKQAVKTI